MANNNVQNVRFLRNGAVYGSRETALTNLNGQTLTAEQDGSIILARYGSGNDVKTLVGLVYVNGGNHSLTIFDIDGASADVEELRTEINNKLGEGITSANTVTGQLEALSGNTASTSADTSVEGAKRYAEDLISTLDKGDTAVTGSYVSQVSEADGLITVERVALPDASSVADDNKVVTDVTQDKGAITATASLLSGVKLSGYTVGGDDSGKIADTDTLGAALGKLQGQINGMDKAADAVAGQVVTTVAEADGKVTETKANVKDLELGGYAKTNDTGDIASADTINVALSKLENQIGANSISNDDHSIVVTPQVNDDTDIKVNIKSGEKVILLDNDGIYTDLDLVKITTGLPETVKERYQFLASDDTQIGVNIDVPKDSHIVSINYITDTGDTHYQNLEYVYIDASGETQTTYVDMSELVIEAEFASGVTVTNHVAHGVVDPTSESFLTVGADGFKVSGVQDAINSAVNALDADVSGNSTHVTVGVVEEDGKITGVTVSESNIANADDLATLSGKAVTAVAMTGGTAQIVANDDDTKKITINTDGSQILMTNYTKGSDSGAVEATDSVNAAIGKLENQIASKVDALDAEVSGETSDGKVNVTVTQENGVITAVTVVGTDIASASALTDEIAARKAVDGQTGQTYAANASSTYISGATDLNDADVKLDAALKSLSDATVNAVQVNGVTLTETDNAVNVQISGATGAASPTSSEAIVVTTDDSTGAVTLGLGIIDCGTY